MDKEELADIYNDWEEAIKVFRNRPQYEDLTSKEQDKVLRFLKQARTPTKEGIVSYQNIVGLIRDNLGHAIGKIKIAELCKELED